MFAVKLFAVFNAVSVLSEACTKPKLSIPAAVYKSDTYCLREGNSFEIYCTGDTKSLVIERHGEKLDTDIINSTTVKAVVDPIVSYYEYACRDICSVTHALVLIDTYPEVIKFDCTSENLEMFRCIWRVSTDFVDYELSYNLKNGSFGSDVMCKHDLEDREYYSCLWNVNHTNNDALYVFVNFQICNILDCFNETRKNYVVAVTKLDAPRKLKAYDISSHEVLFEWVPFKSTLLPKLDIYFTIEYMFSEFKGLEPRVLISNTTTVLSGRYLKHHFNFPCSDRHYTLRVSCRPAKASLEHMSEFASISIRMEPDSEERELDPICQIETPDVMLYKIRELRRYFTIEVKKIKKLRLKLNKKKYAMICTKAKLSL